MSAVNFRIAMCLLVFCCAAAAEGGPHLECKVVVPDEYKTQPFPPPNGQPEWIRYRETYEAFWWNCVAVRAADMNARCPISASGTPAAAAGAGDGAVAAMNGVRDLVKKFGTPVTQAYLKKLASPASMIREKLHGYFDGEPTPESQQPEG
jgi:hypothetical protein